jgi:hypothetical protein
VARVLVRVALAFGVALLWVGPVWEGGDVLVGDESFQWGEALQRGLLVGCIIGGVAAFNRNRTDVAGVVTRGHLPPGATADPWLRELNGLRSSRSQDRVAVPVVFLLVAGWLAAVALRGDEPWLWLLVAAALLAAVIGAVVLHRQLRTAERLIDELEERVVRE